MLGGNRCRGILSKVNLSEQTLTVCDVVDPLHLLLANYNFVMSNIQSMSQLVNISLATKMTFCMQEKTMDLTRFWECVEVRLDFRNIHAT